MHTVWRDARHAVRLILRNPGFAGLAVTMLALGLFWADSKAEQKAPAVTSGSVDVGDARLFYDEAGTGDAVIMIHGGFLTKEMWDGHFERFSAKYRAVRYDARNHGLSRSEPVTFAHFEDLDKLMAHLNIEKAVIMGLSMGGYIAIDFALKHPEKVNGLILVAPGLSGYEFNDPESIAYQKRFREAAEGGDTEKIIEVFMEAWTYGPRRKAEDLDPALRDKIRGMARKTLVTWNSKSKELAADPPSVGRLKDIQARTLCVVGDLDMPSILDIVRRLEKDVPHFEKAVIPGVAHMVNLEKPAAFDRVVLDFLRKVYRETP